MSKVEARGALFNVQLLGEHASDEAEGHCAVYLHGLIMDNLSSGYFTFAQAVSARLPLLLYDMRGHGKSERTPTGYKASEHARDLLALTEALGLGDRPLHLIASSFGGAVALECERLAPERVASLVLIDGHPSSGAFFEQLGGDLTAPPDTQQALIAEHFQHWLSRDLPRKRARLAARATALLNETSLIADLRASAEEASNRTPLSPLSERPPTLALYGADSDALPLARAQLSAHPEVTWRLFEGRSHALLWEETRAVTEALCAWLEQRLPSEHLP